MFDSSENHIGLQISSVDGRYASKLTELSPIVSEYGLMERRALVEIEWFKILGSGILPDVSKFSLSALEHLDSLIDKFNESDYHSIKEHEFSTNHDVKAVEYWLRDRISENEELSLHTHLIHFGCTSEDINNLAYALILQRSRREVILPAIDNLGEALENKAHDYSKVSLLGMTHGQPATPTTLGKEYSVYVDRLSKTVDSFRSVAVRGKFSGATGNFAAIDSAYPEVDWQNISKKFVKNLGLEVSQYTTQIEPHDYAAEYCDALSRINTVLYDLARDSWLYISRGVLKQSANPNEVGSSTMPHKVNPIDFENAWGNFGFANTILRYLSETLPVSMMQRDLSDSTLQRNIGLGLAHSLIGYKSLLKGLGKIEPNIKNIERELNENWQVLAEPLQTVLRRQGVPDAYEKLKDATRDKSFSKDTYNELVNGLDMDEHVKSRMLQLTPRKYIGKSVEIAESVKYSRGQ